MTDHVILMTGATGAVGRPLLAELLRRDDVERVVALQHVDGRSAAVSESRSWPATSRPRISRCRTRKPRG